MRIKTVSYFRLRILWLSGSLLLTGFLVWYAVGSYLNSLPVAQTMQRGLALSLGQSIEGVATRDPSFATLAAFRSNDLAYFALLDRNGKIRFHSNNELIGETVEDTRYLPVFTSGEFLATRIRLRTGEDVYESHLPMHLPGGTLALRLVLHTWSADQIVEQAKVGMLLLLGLTAVAWGMGLFALHLQRRDLKRQEALVRHEHLAQLGELGAVMAHEVRTPLAGIKGFAQLLHERLDDPRQQQYASKIVDESERLERLVTDLLTYARQEPQPEGCALVEEAVQRAWENLSSAADISGVRLLLTGCVDKPVACPPDRLQQLLLNLFNNAVQAMPDGGELQVILSQDADQAVLLIADNGTGFSTESLLRVFDPFYTTRASGSGLGLAICRKLVEAYRGTITAKNGKTGGAELTLQLPLVKEKQ